MRTLVFDTETTGLEPKQGHRIIEVGCVEVINRRLTGNNFHYYLNPQREIDEGAVEVHGLTTDFLSDKPLYEDIADELYEYLKGAEVIIHNAAFDLSFLNGELGAIKKELIDKNLVIDSLSIARNKFPGTSNSLDSLCKKFNIDLSKRTKHNALLDCELLREVYINLLDVKEPKFNLSNIKEDNNVSKENDYNKKVLEISESEINLHKEFLKKELKKNYY